METQTAVLKFALSVQKNSTEFGELHQEVSIKEVSINKSILSYGKLTTTAANKQYAKH